MFITQPPLLCQLISISNMIRPKKDNSCDKKQLSPGVTRNVNVPVHRKQGVGRGSVRIRIEIRSRQSKAQVMLVHRSHAIPYIYYILPAHARWKRENEMKNHGVKGG